MNHAEKSTAARRPRVAGIGEVLWDVLPGGRRLGGAPANFAYHAHSLGAQARIISRVGDDANGHAILDQLAGLGLDTETVDTDPDHPTGTVTVALGEEGQPSYTIHEGVAWDHLAATPAAKEFVAGADAVCFGTLAQRSPESKEAVRALVAATPARALRVFDVNLRGNYYDAGTVAASLDAANVLKLNHDEVPVVAGLVGLKAAGTPREAADAFAERFGLEIVVLTRGAHGSLVWAGGESSEHAGIEVEVADTVGAGDSFTAGFVMGRLLGLTLAQTHEAAHALAAYVCTQHGATPAVPDEVRARFLKPAVEGGS